MRDTITKKSNPKALLPIAVFLVLYLGLGIVFEYIMKNSGSADIPSTTKGGYHLTDMHVRGLNEARSMVINAFGANMCISHKEAFVNAVTNGKPSSFLFEDSWLDLPTEIMMYGTNIFSVASDGDTPPPAVIL